MLLSFPHTISALAYSFIRERCSGDDPEVSFLSNRVAQFVLEQHSRMPDYLRLPIVLLTFVFDASGILSAGRPFHRLPPERRWRHIQNWKGSLLGGYRDLMRLYESLIIYGWCSMRNER